ncbi:MAG: hypothetical protein IPJ06_18105 [Saprospiraceae bacterium]|nr:hypothetical protein [Saprospiraceae bacterium]
MWLRNSRKAFPPGFDTPSTPRSNYNGGLFPEGSECDTVTTSVAVPEMGKTYDLTLTPNPSSGPVDMEITLPEYQGHKVIVPSLTALADSVQSSLPTVQLPAYVGCLCFRSWLYVVQLIADGRVVKTEKLVVVGT